MMNILYKLTAVGLWVIFTVACVKDPGNYDYKEVTAIEPFQLEGIEDRYDAETLALNCRIWLCRRESTAKIMSFYGIFIRRVIWPGRSRAIRSVRR